MPQRPPPNLQQKPLVCMCAAKQEGVLELRQALLDNAPEEFVNDPKIIGDIVDPGSVVILVIPIDKEAPKGRIILPRFKPFAICSTPAAFRFALLIRNCRAL